MQIYLSFYSYKGLVTYQIGKTSPIDKSKNWATKYFQTQIPVSNFK